MTCNMEYPKINTLFKRDANNIIIPSQFTQPEFEYLKDNKFECTEKIDGTNIRIEIKGKEITFKGRTEKDLFEDIQKGIFEIPEFITEGAKNILLGLITLIPEKRMNCKELMDLDWMLLNMYILVMMKKVVNFGVGLFQNLKK
mgnify:CR=1 FL=1